MDTTPEYINRLLNLDVIDALQVIYGFMSYETFLEDYAIGACYYRMAKRENSVMNEKNCALIYAKIAVTNKNILANDAIGYYYFERDNPTIALYYYKLSAKLGCSESINNVGCCYDNLKKYNLAIEYYEMAINLGATKAMFNLGGLYVRLNKIDNAIKYYEMAADKNDKDAIENLYDCIARTSSDCEAARPMADLYFEQKNYDLAYKYYYKCFKYCDAQIVEEIWNKHFIKDYKNILTEYKTNCDKLYFGYSEDCCCICMEKDNMLLSNCCWQPYCKNCWNKINACALCRRYKN